MIVFEKGGSVKKEGWVGSCFLRGGRNRALTTTLHGLDFPFNDSQFYIFVIKTVFNKHIMDYPVPET